MKSREKIIIIGGGLSGLSTAYLLQKRNIEVTILEASSRLGGRIQTIKGKLETPLELGATWFADKHEKLSILLEELEIKKFPQFSKGVTLFQTKSFEPPQQFTVPESESPSYRIAGGTEYLIEKLLANIDSAEIKLSKRATAITSTENGLIVETADGDKLEAENVIICIPPQLAGAQIKFSPELPKELQTIFPTVQTWMAGAVKFTAEYANPFWRENGFSGMIFSHSDIIVEMYDQTNFEEDRFALTGFLNGGAAAFDQQVRKENVIRQLTELLGEEAGKPVYYSDKVWNDEYVIEGNQLIQVPHQNNGHPLLQKKYLGGKVLFAATETAEKFPGYMEGAIEAAIRVSKEF